jgi:hypothetical protein
VRYDTRIGFSSFVVVGRVVAEGVRDKFDALEDFIEEAALLVPVLGRMEGIGAAASVTSQLHYIFELAPMHG